MGYEIKLKTFEGPLDLLFHLIEKNEIDIYNIPISEITNQYLEYINSIQNLDMEVASEFLVMAATLLEIKSKMLLPNPVEEQLEFEADGIDPRRDLVVKLIEYKKFKTAADFFKEREDLHGRILFKAQEHLEDYIDKKNVLIENVSFEKEILINAVNRLLKKANREDQNRKEFFKELKRDIYTVDEKIVLIRNMIINKDEIGFNDLCQNDNSKLEIIVTFLALLELLKLKEIKIEQSKIFGEISIYGVA